MEEGLITDNLIEIKDTPIPKINKLDRDISLLWAKIEANETIRYTFPSSYWDTKRENTYCGDGKEYPTPKEVVAVLKDFKNRWPSFDNNFGHFSYVKQKELILSENLVELPNGSYEYIRDTAGNEDLVPLELRKDGSAELSDSISTTYKSIQRFLGSENIYTENKLIYKLGVLLYGPPGQGKTALIRKMLRDMDIKDMVAIFLNKIPSVRLLNHVNKSLKERVKIFIFEELTEAIDKDHLERFLNFLDGEHSMNKSITIATTNYPEAIPGNIVNRPSRFDKLIYCGPPSPDDRQKLIQYFLKREASKEELCITEGLSIAAIKEICLRVIIEEQDFIKSAKELQERNKICERNFKNSKSVGFSGSGKLINGDYYDV